MIEITFDHIVYILGIIFGVSLTLLGISFTEHLKYRRHIKKLTCAFKNETLDNFNKTNFNLGLLKEERTKSRQSFHLEAFQQLKLEVLIDWIKSELCSKIYDGYTYAEEYNKRVPYPKKYEEEMGSEEVILKEIQKAMFHIDQKITDSTNIIKTIKRDVKESKKKGFGI